LAKPKAEVPTTIVDGVGEGRPAEVEQGADREERWCHRQERGWLVSRGWGDELRERNEPVYSYLVAGG